ncbi:MAG: MDR family MFS transporter [Gemmatimonadota bacterium]|nr:MDR family MFS transporter [Gemmatimonadota bacterium]
MSHVRSQSAGMRLSDSDRVLVYSSMLVTLFLAALDQTIVATALPRMVEDLQAVDRYAWVATAYLLASTALALVYGKLADTYSRKRITLGAVVLFLTGSILCGLAGMVGRLPVLGDGMNQLIVARGLQGLGGGGIFAMTFIIIADLFTPAERGRYQGYVGAVFGLASVLGPLVGGLLTDHAGGFIPGVEGWRWVFFVNVPIGGVALWLILRRMPVLEPPGERARPDFVGGFLLMGGLVPLILSIQLDKRAYPWFPGLGVGTTASGWAAWTTPGLFLVGVLGIVGFIIRSRGSASPILDLRLFRNRVFRTANTATFFFGASVMSITIFLPLLLVNVLGISATGAGAALIPFSGGVVLGATMAGHYVDRVGYRRQIFGGGLLFAAAVLLLAGLDADASYARVMLYTVLCGLGAGPSMPLFTLAVQNAVDVRMVGQATSASQFFRQIGATVGAAVMGTVLVTTLSVSFATLEIPPAVLDALPHETEQLVSTGGASLPETIRERYRGLAAEATSPERAGELRAEGQALAERVSGAVVTAFERATRRIYWLTSAIILVATLLTLRIPELRLRTTHDRDALQQGP